MLQHLGHSPKLAASNFRLLGLLKQHLSEQQFMDEYDIVAVTTYLQVVDWDFFEKGFNVIVPHCDKCLNNCGD